MGQGRKIQMFVSGGRAFQNHRFSMQFIVVLERDDVIWAVFCAFPLLEPESRGTHCACNQDKEEPMHFFPEEMGRRRPRESVLKSEGKFIRRQKIQLKYSTLTLAELIPLFQTPGLVILGSP